MENLQFDVDEGNLLIGDTNSNQANGWKSSCLSSFPGFRQLRRVIEICGKIFSKIWNIYIIANTKSWSAVLLLLLIIGVNLTLFFVAVVTHPVQIDYSLTAFEVPDHKASRRLESLIAAKKDQTKARQEDAAKKHHRVGRDNNPEVVIKSQYRQKWKLDIIYLAEDGNVFTKEKLKYIHKIEKNLLKHEKFHDFCWKTKTALNDEELKKDGHGCMPANSLIDFFYRTDRFDGEGKELSDIKTTLDYLLTKLSTFWFVDATFGADKRESKFLRSQIHFGIPLKGYTEEETSVKQQHDIFKDFLVKYVEQLGKASSDQVTVLYGSPEIYDYEIKSTFLHDVLLAAISFGLIILLLFLLTSFSLWLTIFGVLTIIFSIPMAYFSYRVLLGIKTVGILTGTTVFVIIGIGVDDVFVFINVFKQATHLKDTRERMKHSILTAGKATFFTSFTTAAAFGANILSKVPAVHDFGLFTCILVMTCWLMVLLLMPPSIFLWQRWLIKCEMCMCLRCCCRNSNPGNRLIENEESEMSAQPMRQEFEMNSSNIGNSDVDISGPTHTSECCTVTNILTRLMERFVAKPVIKGRFVVVVLFLAITAGSIGVITRLKTASGRPKLFASNSNLQRVLNIRSNLSGESIDCSSCSEVMGEVHPGSTYHVKNYHNFKPLVRRSVDDEAFANHFEPLARRSVSDEASMGMRHIELLVRRSVENEDMANSSISEDGSLNTTATTRGSTRTSMNQSIAKSVVLTTDGLRVTDIKTNETMFTATRSPAANKTGEMTSEITTNATTSSGWTTSYITTPRITTDEKSTPVARTTAKTTEMTTPKRTTTSITTTGLSTTSTTTKKKPTIRPTTEPLCPKPCKPVKRPMLDKNAMVFLVFGIKGVDRSDVTGKHVIGDMGTPIYDDKFTMSGSQLSVAASGALVKALCKICNAAQNNTELVIPGGADCFPRQMYKQLKYYRYKECQQLQVPNHANKMISLSMIGLIHGEIKWMAMAFESTTFTGKSAFKVAKDFAKWENFTKSILSDPDIPEMLKSGFQTSYSWVHMFSEIIAVNGAIYGITMSLVMCLASVVIFTGNFRLSLIVFVTISGALSLVVALFYFVGWQLGAIEAISLSILVGTSVDYTIHITEGYMMASRIEDFDRMTSKEIRFKRVNLALSHIGVSIFSSAITTLIAAIPLCMAEIRLFAKFGEILAINTGVSILYTLTICVSLLSIMGPTRYRGSFKSHFLAFVVVAVTVGSCIFVLYMISVYGHVHIPGPSGDELFH